MKKFVTQPLDKQMNRGNLVDKIAKLGDRIGPKPSATIGNIGELSPDSGDLIINILRVIDQETQAEVLLLNQDGIATLAGANDKNIHKWVDENGNILLQVYESGYPDYVAYIRADNIIGGYTSLRLNPYTDTATVTNLEVLGDIALLGTLKIDGIAAPFYLPFATYSGGNPITASNTIAFAVTPPATLNIQQWAQSWFVATTNSGSHYWNIQIKRASDNAQIAAFTTAAGSASTWTVNNKTSSFDVSSISAADKLVYIECDMVGSPGALSLGGPVLKVAP